MFRKLPSLLIRGVFFSIFLLFIASTNPFPSQAGCGDYFSCQKEIQRVKGEISRLQGEEKSLKNQIAYLDNQIYLTELEIQAKEAEIELLNGDIGNLSTRLERIASFLEFQERVFVSRARSAYISDQLSSFDIVLGANSLDSAIRRIRYLKVLEEQDHETLEEMKETRTSFNEQKSTLENKKSDVERLKAEVEAHKRSLSIQQANKQDLLEETKGNEANYQEYLKQLQAELNSILAALARGGTLIGEVNAPKGQWQRIANQGNTGCTTYPGYHVHYAVGVGPVGNSKIDYFVNPWNFLSLSGSTVVSGSYNSPGGPSNYLTQGYWSQHQALDVVSQSGWNGSYYGIYASASGTAYLVSDTSWGSWCRTGKAYNGPAYGIVIDHGNGYKTLYWHIQP